MHRTMNEVSTVLDFRAVKALMGALAIAAAAAVARGTAITAPLFGALAALALSAGAALSALLELASPERNRVDSSTRHRSAIPIPAQAQAAIQMG